MKLQRLHLKAFGAFTDRSLDLSGGKEGLHLIHGPNEAGKSTTLRAITQLLYGIETQTSDAFLHPMKGLRIGATLANEKQSITLYRRKGNKATLLAEDEKTALPDDALAPYIGGVDVDAFRNLFGLTHDQLVQGGQALVQGEGDVGQALFSAASGMGHLRALLSKLDGDAGEIFKPSASKPRINSALAQLAAARKSVKAAQLSSREWEALDGERTAAEDRRTELDEQLREARAEQARLKRIHEALPLVSQRAALLEALTPLAATVLLPPDFSERRIHAQTAARNAGETLVQTGAAIARLKRELEPLHVNTLLLAREDEIEKLHQDLGVNEKARNDLERKLAPELARLRDEAERTLHHLRPHWSIEQAEELRLPPGQKQRLAELDRRGQSCRDTVNHAIATLDHVQRQREQALAERAHGGEPAETALLEAALKRARPLGESEAALRDIEARVDALQQSITSGIARLGHWRGTMEALEALPVPTSESIEQFRLDIGEAARAASESEKQLAGLVAERERAESDLAAYQRQHHAPSLEALEEARGLRQQSWAFARAAWEDAIPPDKIADSEARAIVEEVRERHPEVKNLADAVAVLVTDADELSDRLRTEADRVAQRAQLESAVAILQEKCAKQLGVHAAAEAQRDSLEATWKALWAPAAIDPRTPAEMAAWRKSFDALQSEIASLHETAKSAKVLQTSIATQRAELAKVLASSGLVEGSAELSLAALIDHAEIGLARQREIAQQRAHLEKTLDKIERVDLPAAEAALARAREEEDAWREAWSAMMQVIGARPDAVGAEALAIVEAIDEVLDKHTRSEELQQRVDFILRDDADFRRDARALASAVGQEAEGDEAAIVRALYQALKQNREASGELKRLTKQLRDEEERHRNAEAALARAEGDVAALCDEARVEAAAALPDAEKGSAERQRIEDTLRDIEKRLFALVPGQGMDAITLMVEAEDAEALSPTLEALAERIEDLDDERLALQESIGELKNKLAQMNGGSQAADAAAQAQSLIAAIAEDGEEYARLRVAHFALSRAIERYRAANQEPLLARAGEIFQTLTLGSFAELRADVDDKDRHVLLGVRGENGSLVDVAGMSEGTADQLYLALRIASLERHLERHAPIPFILDDILVNFDDARAAAALDVLAALSERTQVIYFTHHQHLVELAKAKVGKKTLFVHALKG
jgi:uncharacterized protein YhaN